MISCQCGKKIEYFVAIAHNSNTPLNPKRNPVIIGGGSSFACQECTKSIVTHWKKHNKGRTDPYRIGVAKINVKADTKSGFIFRASPQLFNQFKKMNWWLHKLDIQSATKNIKKNISL